MALIHSRLAHATSFFDLFQTSFSEFHGSHVLLKYGSSISFRKHGFDFSTFSNQIPHGILSTRKRISRYNSRRNLCHARWIDKWNEPRKQNRPKPPQAVLDYLSSDNEEASNSDFSSNYRGGNRISDDERGGSTMEKIVRKLKKFGYIDDVDENKEKGPLKTIEKGSVEEIFHVEEGILPNTRGGFSKESPLSFGAENMFGSNGEVRFPWEKPEEKEDAGGTLARRRGRTSLAELTLPESELRRLRFLTFQKKHKMKIGGAGVTQAVVDVIHEKWKTSEIVRLKIEGPPALNMKRMHEILERKTGGLVIWRSGTSLSLYRGVSYEVPAPPQLSKRIYKRNENTPLPQTIGAKTAVLSESSQGDVHASQSKRAETSTEDEQHREQMTAVKYEDEIDKLLDSLGPRYTDWPGLDPLPVDADMLPAVVSDYKPPFRILPYGMRSSLGVKEATALRRLVRKLPPHFALGRNRQLQGLAVAMAKLWERSLIAKISLKRGVQLTTSERMAEELKRLTGGILLSRNKDFLVFYRGKSFLSPEVTEALLERERLAKSLQDEEEHARLKASALVIPGNEKTEQSGTAGSLEETMDADAKWGTPLNDNHKEKVMKEAERLRHTDLVRKLERKLAFAERKLIKAEQALSKVEAFLRPATQQSDPDSITEEERFMFRKLGLRMKAFLLLGRREVFDGTVENMHLHWKYRELVKVMVKANTFDHVKKIALQLEAESGGVLVSIDKVSKGYAIIVFRGKDYERPSLLRPKNLLTKRKALARSIELQRHEAFLKHISALQSRVDRLKSEIEQMDTVKDQGDQVLYATLDSAYSTENDSEEEEYDDYMEAYDTENGAEDEKNIRASEDFVQVQDLEGEYENAESHCV